MYGNLTVITGGMFSGKTTELLKRILWAKNGRNKNVLIIKPSFDNRYSETQIVSHDGLSTMANSISSWNEIANEASLAESIFIDEIQFFEQPQFRDDIVECVKKELRRGGNVTVNGLSNDWEGNKFRITAEFLSIADDILKLKANCAVCGKSATKTHKINPIGSSVELGSNELYEPRCNKHWNVYENTLDAKK